MEEILISIPLFTGLLYIRYVYIYIYIIYIYNIYIDPKICEYMSTCIDLHLKLILMQTYPLPKQSIYGI